MMLEKGFRFLTVGVLLVAMAVSFVGCAASGNASDLMNGIKASFVSERKADDAFVSSQMKLALKLLQASAEKGGNICISPLSIQLALAMTANGAAGQTRLEMENVLGNGLPVEELNEYLHSYADSLPTDEKCSLRLANSIWFRDDAQALVIEESFLQTNADFYGAQISAAPFNDKTLNDINAWVRENTDGSVEKILDSIEEENIMYLLNAVAFDAQWAQPYNEWDVHDGIFLTTHGEAHEVEQMHSMESIYLEDNLATGFVKQYAGDYSFAVLLPNEDISLESYVSQLTVESVQQTLENAQEGIVVASIPKFSYDFSLCMNDILAELGMPTAFDSEKADFSAMGHAPGKNIYISEVLHKTYIGVDTLGTKAGAVTKVAMNATGAIEVQWTVTLDRPFLYMILDNANNLPVFIGTVTDIGT